jgi:hypothetical protein
MTSNCPITFEQPETGAGTGANSHRQGLVQGRILTDRGQNWSRPFAATGTWGGSESKLS